GGTPRRLTYNSAAEIPESFSPDGKSVLFSASIQDPVTSAVFPSGRMTELYSVDVDGNKAPVQILATPARYVSWLPGGKNFLYQDVKGFEDEWRKHHTSSVTRDIWMYDSSTGNHTNLTSRGGEDTNPVAASDGTFYFLSERDGATVNVYKAPLDNPSAATAVTNFKTHPVRFLSRDNAGKLAFTYDGEIYTLAPGGKPAKVAIDVLVDETPDIEKVSTRTGARGPVPSPDGKNIAFIYRGNVFVTSTEYSTTRQITDTPAAEADVVWSPDGTTLYYTSERDGRYNIYKAVMNRPDDEPDFAHATLVREEAVFKPDNHERVMPQVSPDGNSLAFILDRHILAVMNLKNGKVKKLTDGSTYLQNDGRFNFTWSPDSK
ncbi:MAG: peptidase S41, partial [Muribaculaceae bacterium]|nr:peptidase S41 [Muribaculaceae bacterium]